MERRGGTERLVLYGFLFACVCATMQVEAQWMSQTIPLRAGWNAVHVKVNPYSPACGDAFGGGGIDQVTWWNLDRRDDGTGSVTAETYAWYSGGVEPNTFGAVLGDERYLVHAVAATNLVIVGTPAIPRGRIHLGRMNLIGLNIPSGLVSCYDYFRYFENLADSPYWQVSAMNEVVMQRPADTISDSSQAFWLDTTGEGTVTYTGPFEVSVDTGDKTLLWSSSTSARTIEVKNVTGSDRVARFALESSLAPPLGQGTKAGDVKVKIESVDYSAGYPRRVYLPVTFPFSTNVAAGATFKFKIRPNLDAMPYTASGDYLGIVAISDEGSTIDDAPGQTAKCLYRVGLKSAGTLASARQPAGLWVGSVALTGVNRARMLKSAEDVEWDENDIQDATQPFEFRLILHVADDGAVKILKQAFIGSAEADNAVAPVMTDRETAKLYRAWRPAAKIRRVSSANFPFMEPKLMSGCEFMTPDGTLSATVIQDFDDKVNPFVHAYHPEHDNLAFNNKKAVVKDGGNEDGTGDYESWSVSRQISLKFLAEDPVGSNDDWNRTVTGGIYTERITGLNKTPILVQGAFRLSKVLDTPELTTGVVH